MAAMDNHFRSMLLHDRWHDLANASLWGRCVGIDLQGSAVMPGGHLHIAIVVVDLPGPVMTIVRQEIRERLLAIVIIIEKMALHMTSIVEQLPGRKPLEIWEI